MASKSDNTSTQPVLVGLLPPKLRSHDEFYRELTSRNRHFVPEATQAKLRRLRFLVAGCGSTGGACIEPLSRLGLENFALADNGDYELNNLNRQHALLTDLNKNKAVCHAELLLKINPFTRVRVYPEGVTQQNVEEVVFWADLIMDAVDVTSASGMEMKLLLHEEAQRQKKPVFTSYDLGFCQYGESFDYREGNALTLGGRLAAARAQRHPLKALLSILPLEKIPAHCLVLIKDLLTNPGVAASQLCGTAFLLSSIITAAVIRFVESGQLVEGWRYDLESIARPATNAEASLGAELREEIQAILRQID